MARSSRLFQLSSRQDPTGDPLGDLTNAANTIIATSGFVPDMVVMGIDALNVFLNHQAVKDQLNRLHLIAGGIQPAAPEGVGSAQFIGRLFRPYVSIYGYSETYENESTNVLTPMIAPKNDILLGCSKSPAVTSYGAVTQIEQDGSAQSYSD